MKDEAYKNLIYEIQSYTIVLLLNTSTNPSHTSFVTHALGNSASRIILDIR